LSWQAGIGPDEINSCPSIVANTAESESAGIRRRRNARYQERHDCRGRARGNVARAWVCRGSRTGLL